MAILCFCPPDKFDPLTPILCSNFLGCFWIKLYIHAFFVASINNFSSFISLPNNILFFIVSWNKTGSCETYPINFL